MDRRQNNRCPSCQGTMVAAGKGSSKGEELWKCRNSICKFNHRNVVCPRCKEKNLSDVNFTNHSYQYTCGSCQNRWNLTAD